jgi:hypothetical protein
VILSVPSCSPSASERSLTTSHQPSGPNVSFSLISTTSTSSATTRTLWTTCRPSLLLAQPSIQLNMAKSKTTALQEARERGMQLLSSGKGPTVGKRAFPCGKDHRRGNPASQTRRLAAPALPIGPATMPTAESAPSTAFPAIRRLGTPLGTSGHVPGRFRAQAPCCSVPSTVSDPGRRPYHSPCQTRRSRHPILQDMRPSRICSRL